MAMILSVSLCLCGCEPIQSVRDCNTLKKQYTATFLTLFDTVTTIVGLADSEEAFKTRADWIHDELLVYHQLFDIYNEYEGINNLKTVNESAGIGPVTVDSRIIALLKECEKYETLTGGKVNAAMGSVLSLWHEARSDGRDDPGHAVLPEDAALRDAAEHMGFEHVIIDEEASTVYIADPMVQLDVGAIAKGWSVQQVAAKVPEGLLISVGGNVCATGPKDEAGTPWVVGIQDPENAQDPEAFLHTIYVSKGCVVTSGDYQRAYMVDGKMYHHIIDPDTLYPSRYWRSVTIVCSDSGLADALSTALFLLPLEQGKELLAQFDAQAVWVGGDSEIFYSSGFEELIRT